MAASSEVELACNPQLSAKEVTEILQEHHALPAGPHYDPDWKKFGTGRGEWEHYWALGRRIGSHRGILPLSLSDPLSDTCGRLRGRILKWLCNSSRDCSMFWITDPFTVASELTAAQTFTGIFNGLNRLGANTWVYGESPEEFILGVVYQLAERYPPYRGLLIKELVDNPTILKKSPRTLFKKLIVEPWDTLSTSHSLYLQRPPLIVLEFDWDLNMRNDHDHRVLIELIQGYSSRRKITPLLWLITTHPNDHQLSQALWTIDVQPVYEHEALTYGSAETNQDVNDVLRSGFHKIRNNHSTIFTEEEKWPLDAQLVRLTSVVSGVPHFACAVVRFVGAKGKDPKKQLEMCIKYMAGCPAPSALQPFIGLFHFYHQFLLDMLPIAMDILSLCLLYPVHSCLLANLLGVDQTKFYDLISDNLDHILDLHLTRNSEYRHTLEFSGRAFEYFLWNAIDSETVSHPHAPFVRLVLRIPSYGTLSTIMNAMTWKPSRPMDLWKEACWLQEQAYCWLWYSASELEDGGYGYFSKFDFRRLVPISSKIEGTLFYCTLLRLQRSQPKDEEPLVRTKPVFPSDRQLIKKCKTVATPMRFEAESELSGTDYPQYALVGRGIQTVLVILLLGVQRDHGVNIYSLDMLDDL